MRNSKTLSRLLAAALAIVMALSLAIPAFAAEIDDSGPDLEAIAAMFADWDGSYELPDLSELSPEDQEIVKALVDAIMTSREAQDEIPLTVSFSDVPTSHTFYRGIIYCASKGIVNGYDDGTFRPAATVAKNHFSAMLARAFYADDVAKYDTESYKKAYGTFGATNYTLAVNGILNDTSFRWKYTDGSVMGTGINRYDMAQMMTNIMAKKGFAASSSQKSAVQSKITDYKNIPSQYRDAVKNVYALGIITGYSDGSFVGNNIMNRGQAAIVIQRMAQYAPVKGDDDNTQYDDGTEQKPSTSNPGTGNNNNAGSSNTGSNTGSSTESNTGSSGNTGTTKPETPTYVLSNGKPITEENVLAMLQELRKEYPAGMTWKNGTYRTGWASNALTHISESYDHKDGGNVSMQSACGGFASLISDSIFGSGSANPARKVSVEYARPGDVIISLNQNGKLLHVAIVASKIKEMHACGGVCPVVSTYDGNNNGKVNYTEYGTLPKTVNGGHAGYVEIWTRYQTDGTPYTGTSSGSTGSGSNTGSSSNNTGTSSSNTGSGTTDTSVNWVTSSNPCGICGKTGGRQVRSSDGARYACESCWNDPSGLGKWFINLN